MSSSQTLDGLRQLIRGRVLLPQDEDFAANSLGWNRAVIQEPLAVVDAEDEDDVVALVVFARDNGFAIAAQPHGHGASGSASGTILLRTGALNRIEVDAAAGTGLVGAGVEVGAVQVEAAKHALTALAGSTPVVTVAGLVLGGGLSWFGRAFGWASDSVSSFDVVDGDGVRRRVDERTDPNLFWALRGGGGGYAIVTSLTLDLKPAPAIFGGRVLWPDGARDEVIAAFRSITAEAPDELSVWLELLQFPGAEPMVALDIVHLGDAASAQEHLQILGTLSAPIMNSLRPLRADELGTVADEPTEPAPGSTRFELLERFDDEVASALSAIPQGPLMIVQVRHLGGAFAQTTSNPFGALTEPYSLSLFGVPFSPEMAERIASTQREYVDRLPVSGRKPVSFLEVGETLGDAIGRDALTRLRDVAEAADPRDVFRSNFPA